MKIFEHQSDIKVASTIPSEWYTSDAFFRQEMHSIFNRGWNLVGSMDSLKTKGDYFTAQAGSENFLIVKFGDGSHDIKGLVNVCRHRAGPVAVGCGNSKVLQCKYHGWIYDLNGNLIGTPEFQGVENFEKQDHPLPEVKLGFKGPFIFASLNPLISFEEFCGEIKTDDCKQSDDVFSTKLVPFLKRDYEVACNWKVYVDNYLEGYHLPLVHKGLSAELDYSQYRTETSTWFSEQFAPAKNSASYYRTDLGDTARYYWLFPSTMVNAYQNIVQTNVVLPISKNKTIVKFIWYEKPDSGDETRVAEMIKFSDVIQEEDRLICEQVQKNLNSVTYESGRYSVKRENGLHHFHSLLSKLNSLKK